MVLNGGKRDEELAKEPLQADRRPMAGSSDLRRRLLFALLTLLVVLTVLYLRGTLDPIVYRFGLNHYPCTHSLTGSVTCGAGVAGTPYS
jgi:hypothetical protein